MEENRDSASPRTEHSPLSLHSSKSCGIGEFFDLIPIIDWAKKLGFDVIQLLPLNDTGIDTTLSAISAFALNPLHLSLAALPGLNRFPDLQRELKEMQALNSSQRIDYPEVQQKKYAFLKHYYGLTSPTMTHEPDYEQFLQKNPWLKEYALFKSIKISRQWQSWEQWPAEIGNPSPSNLKTLYKEYESQMAFHIFLQYLCFQQLQTVKKHAEKQGIFLKGDIPILINRESADVWLHRTLFLTQFSAGAPPDMYSANGQNWGFPLYDWKEIEKKNFAWWKQRLNVATQFYDIYRIDHVVGFFRIWAIPKGHLGKEGAFIPKEKEAWVPHGEKIMRMMMESAPTMLPIGEDLGNSTPGSQGLFATSRHLRHQSHSVGKNVG